MKVSIGKTTIAAWVASGVAFLPPAINQIITYVENNQTHFSGSEKLMAITGATTFAVSLVMRYLQAVHLIKAGK